MCDQIYHSSYLYQRLGHSFNFLSTLESLSITVQETKPLITFLMFNNHDYNEYM